MEKETCIIEAYLLFLVEINILFNYDPLILLN